MALGKKTLYVMLPVNLCLWSFIGYKIYTTFNDSEVELPIENSLIALKVNEDTSTYKLALNYADPFLKEESHHKPKQNNSNSGNSKSLEKIRQKNTQTVTPTPSKEIKYLGLIQNKSSGITTALISINGRSYIIKKGEVVEGINFESITEQIIIAKIGKEKLKISKS